MPPDALQVADIEGVLRAAIARMLALELAMRLLLGLGLFQRDDLRLGQHQAVLGALGFQRLEPLLHGLQVVPQPHAAHAGGRDREPTLSAVRWRPAPGRRPAAQSRVPPPPSSISGGDPVLQHRLLPADLLQRQLAAFVVQLLEAVKAVAPIAHHLAGLADVAELLGQLQQANLGANDLLLLCHVRLHCQEPAGCARAPIRVSARARPAGLPRQSNQICQIKSKLIHVSARNADRDTCRRCGCSEQVRPPDLAASQRHSRAHSRNRPPQGLRAHSAQPAEWILPQSEER